MAEQAIITTTVNLLQDNIQVSAYLAEPKEPGSYPGIVVLQEIFGVNVHIRDVTERIAKLGYVGSHLHFFNALLLALKPDTHPKILKRAEATPCKLKHQSY